MEALLDRVVMLQNPRGFPRGAVDLNHLSGTLVKGFALQHLEEFATAHHGPDALDLWRASLPPALREQATTEAVASRAWVPLELHVSALTYLLDHFYKGDTRQAAVIGYATSSRDIGAIYRTALRYASPPTILELSSRVWHSYLDKSQLVLTHKDTGAAEAEVRDWPIPTDASIYEVVGSLMAWMVASRARDFTICRLELLTPRSFMVGARWQ